MGGERIWADPGGFEVEIDADLFAEFAQAIMGLPDGLGAAELFSKVFVMIDAFRRNLRVQLIGPTVDVDTNLVLKFGDRQLPPGLAQDGRSEEQREGERSVRQ